MATNEGEDLIKMTIASNDVQTLESFLTPENLAKIEFITSLQTIMFDSAINGTKSIEAIELILQHLNVNQRNVQKRTCLHLAAFHNRINIVDLLLKDQRINIDQTTPSGCTALYFAACNGNVKIVEKLLKRNSNPNISTDSGSNALIVASLNGHYETVKILLQYKANPNLKDSIGFTAMHASASNGDQELTDLLQSYGGDITIKDFQQRTPINILQIKAASNCTPTNFVAINQKISSRTYESIEDTTATGSTTVGIKSRNSKKHYSITKPNNTLFVESTRTVLKPIVCNDLQSNVTAAI